MLPDRRSARVRPQQPAELMHSVQTSTRSSLPSRAPSRVTIERVQPEIDGGRYPASRTLGEIVVVEADIFADGHDVLAALLRYRGPDTEGWQERPLAPLVNDRWAGRFEITDLGRYEFTVEAWVDAFASWRRDLEKKFDAGQDVGSELLEGGVHIRNAADRAVGADAERLREIADQVAGSQEAAERVAVALGDELALLMERYPDRSRSATYERMLAVTAERERARYGAWYEVFPRSCSPEPGRHGTFRDTEAWLPYISGMGFDVLYLPPIHPIGRTNRKGPNNSLVAGPDDPGSPWAIGGPEGGHKSVHPELGTIEDFDHLVAAARDHGLEIALDIAFQCSPDHPYVREHPEWFSHRPDGTIKYAENPPKKYQDIYPINFESDDWQNLWLELKSIFLFWIEHGVKIFRVDNPHTKPFPFWEWVISEIQKQHPDTIFLSEAFTRPKLMKNLAKRGFSQSYTYFTWRTEKQELIEYFEELTQSEVKEYLRPNLFANTPDILHASLQFGGLPMFQIRLVLAATLGASYGIYGPAFELGEHVAAPGKEEYIDNEKYQLRHWDLNKPNSLREIITRVNQIRRENPALHHNVNLRFYPVDNDLLLFYGKATPDLSNIILVIVNLDPHYTQSGWVTVPLEEFQLTEHETYQVHDLITEAHYLWHGSRNFVQLNPHEFPAHILRLRRKVRTEQDFDYFM